MAARVRPDSKVRLRYSLALADGEVLDETGPEGSVIALGQGEFAEALEAMLLGMAVGESKTVEISAADSVFGVWDAANVQLLELSALGSEVPLQAGQVVEFDTPQGPVAALIHELDEETVTVDFNHPLCQHDLQFNVEILEIEP